MRIMLWALRGLLFFVLFAFALNNQHEVVLKGFFGAEWHTPMVVVVLASFACGAGLAILALAPRLWRRAPEARTAARVAEPATTSRPTRPTAVTQTDTAPSSFDPMPRDGI